MQIVRNLLKVCCCCYVTSSCVHYFLRGKRTASIVSNTRNSTLSRYPIKELRNIGNYGSFPQLAPTASDN